MNGVLQKVFELCTVQDFDLVAQWRSREEMQAKDNLSKYKDILDWSLRGEDREKILRAFWVRPTVDMFASEMWHVTKRFVSMHLTSGCRAADALWTDWQELVPPGDTAWIFPPVSVWLLKETIQAVRRFKTDCILIIPLAEATNWWLALHQTLTEARTEGPVKLARSTGVCIPSHRVP